MPIRIAMWSGPRNISTALMRSFENRTDCVVSDEPFYASYLAKTDVDHPGRDAIMDSQSRRAEEVIKALTGPLPNFDPTGFDPTGFDPTGFDPTGFDPTNYDPTSSRPSGTDPASLDPQGSNPRRHLAGEPARQTIPTVWYQKLMAHHILPETNLDWLTHSEFRHVFLVRDPQAMLVSLRKVLGDVTAEQTGLPQQVHLFDTICRTTGVAPLVVHSEDVLAAPEPSLRRLCEHVGIAFQDRMLSWPPGPRPSDGVWGPHWYANLYQTTGFGQPRTESEPLPRDCQPVLATCQRLYEKLTHRA